MQTAGQSADAQNKPEVAKAPVVESVSNANGKDQDSAKLTDRIYVKVGNLDVPEDKVATLILYLDDRALTSLKAQPTGPSEIDPSGASVRTLAFDLRCDLAQADAEAWRGVLISARRHSAHRVHVSVGLPGQDPIASDVTLRLNSAGTFTMVSVGLLLALAIVAVFWLGAATDLLRDISPAAPGKKRHFSLARTQMAIWFCLILVSWGSIALVTTSGVQMSDSVLMLMGISGGTGVIALGVDVKKRNRAASSDSTKTRIDNLVTELDGSGGSPGLRARLLAGRAAFTTTAQAVAAVAHAGPGGTAAAAQPAPAVPPDLAALEVELATKETLLTQLKGKADAEARALDGTEGFFKDILSDENGISFHRLQIFMWTVALGLYFLINVFRDLVMPEFNTQLLILMGISSGTYLGFKLPEKIPTRP